MPAWLAGELGTERMGIKVPFYSSTESLCNTFCFLRSFLLGDYSIRKQLYAMMRPCTVTAVAFKLLTNSYLLLMQDCAILQT